MSGGKRQGERGKRMGDGKNGWEASLTIPLLKNNVNILNN